MIQQALVKKKEKKVHILLGCHKNWEMGHCTL